MKRTFDAERLDVPYLAQRMPAGSSLSINTIRKSDLKRLKGLESLSLEFLGLRWLSAPDLTAVPLPPSLAELRIWHSPKLKSLSGIEAAPDLEQLDLRENGLLEDATALRNLPRLRTLSIEGGHTSLQKIANLDFLEGLPLQHLSLVAVDGASLDLGPVARLPELETLVLHGPSFSHQELAKLAAAHPWFYDQLTDLPDCSINGTTCKTCGGRQKMLFLKMVKGLWCPICDKKGLETALKAFDDLVADARR